MRFEWSFCKCHPPQFFWTKSFTFKELLRPTGNARKANRIVWGCTEPLCWLTGDGAEPWKTLLGFFFSEATHPWNTRQREVQFVQVLEVTKSQHPHWKICVFYIFFWKIWFLGCRVENQTNSFSCTPSDVKSQWCASARLGGEVARELPLCPTFKGQPFLNLAGFSSKNGTQKMSSWRCKITFQVEKLCLSLPTLRTLSLMMSQTQHVDLTWEIEFL